jgi:hypothetical protein
VIVDAGYVAYLAGIFDLAANTTFLYIAYGTGTTAESTSQTALVTETARVAATVEIISVYAPFDTLRVTGAFTIGTSPPVVTEIGVFSASAAGTMLARKIVGPSETAAASFTPPATSIMYAHYDFSMKDDGVATTSGTTW